MDTCVTPGCGLPVRYVVDVDRKFCGDCYAKIQESPLGPLVLQPRIPSTAAQAIAEMLGGKTDVELAEFWQQLGEQLPHAASALPHVRRAFERRGLAIPDQRAKQPTACKVFSATRSYDREHLGERVTEWIRANHIEVTQAFIVQSSDNAFHCVTCVVFYRGHP